MSDAFDSNNDLVMLADEYKRLQRQLEDKTALLASLQATNGPAGDFPVDFEGAHNKRYSIDISFDPGDLNPQEQSVTVDSGTVFRCAYVESFLRAIGTDDDPYTGNPITVEATLPWKDRLATFDYFWRVRDTGTDREWTDRPQPSLFFGGAYAGPLWLPRRNILGGGSTIFVEIKPFLSLVDHVGSFFSAGTIEQFILQVSFVGHEVPEDGDL